jgi:hypothetical protein
VLAETHDEWADTRRDMSVDDLLAPTLSSPRRTLVLERAA